MSRSKVVEMSSERVHTTGGSGRRSLATIASLMMVGGALGSCAARHATPESHLRACASAFRSVESAAPWRLTLDADCTIRLRDQGGATLSQLRVSDLHAARVSVSRIIATSEWLFVLHRDPGRLEAYRLPALAPTPVLGFPPVRELTDLAVREEAEGVITAYILDNPYDSDRFLGPDEPTTGSEVIRLRMSHHTSDRRDVVVARVMDRFAGNATRGGEWRTLERIELVGTEIRIVVHENGRRYADYFSFDGLHLERERLAGTR